MRRQGIESYGPLKVFSGSASRLLSEKIASSLKGSVVPGFELGKADISRFKDQEIQIRILENVRGHDVYIVQSTYPPSDNLMELLLMIDALKRASADRITAVIPYYGYARQDKKDEPRVPISSKLVANLLQTAGADRILTMDLHAEQIQGFFDIPVDHLYSASVIVEHFKNSDLRDFVVVSPDLGRVKWTRGLARRLGDLPIAVVDKRRLRPNKAEVINVVGDVKGKKLIIFDDIIDTGGTLIEAAKALRAKGAKDIIACATHAVLSGQASKNIFDSCISKVVVTDTIPLGSKKINEKVEILSVAGLFAMAIWRINTGKSVSELYIW